MQNSLRKLAWVPKGGCYAYCDLAVSAGLVLAGCASNAGLTKAQLAALPLTANMPTGSASYLGKFESKGTTGANTLTEAADWALNANFTAKTVQGTLSNYVATNVNGGNTTITTTTGNVTGGGTITGSTFTIPTATGNLIPTSQTLNGVALATPAPFAVNITNPIKGNFVGDAAAGIYGTGVINGSTYEIYGTKQ